MRREFHLPHSVPVSIQHRDRDPVAPHVPDLDRLVNGGRGDTTIIVLVPVAGKDLELVGGDDHGGARLTHVPDTKGAVAGGGGEDVCVAGVPDSGIDAVGMLLESADGGGTVDGPELDGVVPGGGEEGIAANGVVVSGVDLTSVLVEGADGVRGRGQSKVVELQGAIGHSGDEEGIVGL